jgi:hypothetical protein
MKMKIELVDEETGDMVEQEIPAVWAICDRCRGNGKHDHPAFSNGITADEWNGPDWDEESRDAYLSGRYDVQCGDCCGTGKVLEADWDNMDPDLAKRYEEDLREEARGAREDAYWRRMESGGY